MSAQDRVEREKYGPLVGSEEDVKARLSALEAKLSASRATINPTGQDQPRRRTV